MVPRIHIYRQVLTAGRYEAMLDYSIEGSVIHIETDALQAQVHTRGYVSGVAAGTLMDKATGARDLGFGLSIVDFLLEEGEDGPDEPYSYKWGDMAHGHIPKRYVELPQICTRARKLPFQVVKSAEPGSTGGPSQRFIAVRHWYNWTIATRGRKPGSLWEQVLVFPEDTRYFFSVDRVTSVNAVSNLALRVDMPGHLKHDRGDSFSQVYLSYHGVIPNTEFLEDFFPDTRFRYVRGRDPLPERMVRAYRTRAGPWLAGMTLNPGDVSELSLIHI